MRRSPSRSCTLCGSRQSRHRLCGGYDPRKGSFAFCSSGTWSLFGVGTDKPDLSAAAAAAGFSNEGTIQGGFRPLYNIVGMWIVQECRRDWIKQGKQLSWDDVVNEARKAEPLRSIIDTDAPAFYAGGNMEKKIQDFCCETGQPVPETIGQVARCIYESLALKYRYALEGLEKMKGQRIESLNIVGGINNKFLDQMVADALDRTVVTGPLWSDQEKGLFVQYLNAGKVPGAKTVEDVRRFYEAKVPMNRGCLPIDVARAVMYCVEQKYETGQAIPVTGGQVMLH